MITDTGCEKRYDVSANKRLTCGRGLHYAPMLCKKILLILGHLNIGMKLLSLSATVAVV